MRDASQEANPLVGNEVSPKPEYQERRSDPRKSIERTKVLKTNYIKKSTSPVPKKYTSILSPHVPPEKRLF